MTFKVKNPSMTGDLTEREKEALRIVAEHIIPPSPDLGMPGASDPDILGDILKTVSDKPDDFRGTLNIVAPLIVGQSTPVAAERLDEFRKNHPVPANQLQTLVALHFYRDPRVMEKIGMEPRPPYPQGYEVEEGDWALLDPVRERGPVYSIPPQKPVSQD